MRVHIEKTQSILNVEMKNSAVPFKIPGSNLDYKADSDVFTKRNKHTDVVINTWIQQNGSPHQFRFNLYYAVTEVEGDHTYLTANSHFDFEVPAIASNILVGRGVRDALFRHRSMGESHRWSNITGAPGLAGSYLMETWHKIDGPGNDTRYGNAGIFTIVKIPVEYDLPSGRQFSFKVDGVDSKAIAMGAAHHQVGSDFALSPELHSVPELEKLRQSTASSLRAPADS